MNVGSYERQHVIADRVGIEDAAQGVSARYRGRPLGSIGHLGAFSFHETKNVISGEGGALLINDDRYTHRAEIIREKGTNCSQFFRGQVDKYTWREVGSSFLPGELIAAFLWAQFEEADRINADRLRLWHRYHDALAPLEARGVLRRPVVPAHCDMNGHLYYVLLEDGDERTRMIDTLNAAGVNSVFHYVPLHSSPGGQRYCRVHGSLNVTNRQAERLLRLPMWIGLTEEAQDRVVELLEGALT